MHPTCSLLCLIPTMLSIKYFQSCPFHHFPPILAFFLNASSLSSNCKSSRKSINKKRQAALTEDRRSKKFSRLFFFSFSLSFCSCTFNEAVAAVAAEFVPRARKRRRCEEEEGKKIQIWLACGGMCAVTNDWRAVGKCVRVASRGEVRESGCGVEFGTWFFGVVVCVCECCGEVMRGKCCSCCCWCCL
jgi:hypothetical protein